MLSAAMSAALASAIATAGIGDACSRVEIRSAIASAGVRRLGSVAGDPVVLVSFESSCMCGNVNCPWLVVRTGHPATVLLATYAFSVGVEPAHEALPRLRERAHDSALVTDETLDAYRAGSYDAVAVYRVRGDTGARKPDAVPVRFAPGASSARLHGSVAVGWYDDYTFAAARGQRLTIDAPTSASTPSLTLLVPGGNGTLELRPGRPVTLERSGTYRLHVDGAGEDETPYALTLGIR